VDGKAVRSARMAKDATVTDAPAVREEWVSLVERLMANIERWAEAEGWPVLCTGPAHPHALRSPEC